MALGAPADSRYTPGSTKIVAFGGAASMAAWIDSPE
jgi:hypothetical protein